MTEIVHLFRKIVKGKDYEFEQFHYNLFLIKGVLINLRTGKHIYDYFFTIVCPSINWERKLVSKETVALGW